MSTSTQSIVAPATPPLLAFHGSQAIKDEYLARVRDHRKQDQIRRGFYWEERDGVFRGCAVGCTLHSSNHYAYETELGIPAQLAYLEDGIFENLPGDRHLDWPLQFLEAIPVGADLHKVWWEFMAWILVDEKYGVITLSDKDDVRSAVKGVADCYLREVRGETVTKAEWDAAGKAAWDAWAARAAWDAWDARAARAAWDARAAWAARDEYVLASSKKLLALLAAAKAPSCPASSRSASSRRAPARRLRGEK